MAQLLPFTLSKGANGEFLASYARDFYHDDIVQASVMGQPVNGSVTNLQMSQLQGPASSNLPVFKSMQFSVAFYNFVGDGDFFFVFQPSGLAIRIPAPYYTDVAVLEATPGEIFTMGVVSGNIPINVDNNSTIQLIKKIAQENAGSTPPLNTNLFGQVYLNLSTVDRPAWITTGGSILGNPFA